MLKNLLYKQFLQFRTKEAEHKYKKYKNKLTSILRINKKDFFNKQLVQYRNDTRGTWKVLNNIIKKGTGKSDYPDHFHKNNRSLITDTKETANEFNDHFVNVGYNLVKESVDPVITEDINEKYY